MTTLYLPAPSTLYLPAPPRCSCFQPVQQLDVRSGMQFHGTTGADQPTWDPRFEHWSDCPAHQAARRAYFAAHP